MKLPGPPVAYVGVSVLIALLARPGYDIASTWIILLAGTAGSLLLFFNTIPDMYYQDLSLGNQIGWEAISVGTFALILWLAGGILVYWVGKRGVKSAFSLHLVLGWICGSAYNVFWFAIRSL